MESPTARPTRLRCVGEASMMDEDRLKLATDRLYSSLRRQHDGELMVESGYCWVRSAYYVRFLVAAGPG